MMGCDEGRRGCPGQRPNRASAQRGATWHARRGRRDVAAGPVRQPGADVEREMGRV